MSRLGFAALTALLACGGSERPAARFFPGDAPVPVTGPAVAGVEAWDATAAALLKRWDIAGATLAAAEGGRLVVARGYGYADFDARELMQPGTLLRVGSVAKPFTAVALLRLADQGLVDLEAPLPTLLDLPATADPRLRLATVRHLLEHSGGWNRNRSGDPIADQRTIAAGMGIEGPISSQDLVRYALGEPLDFDPGSHFAYSNVGYVALGRIIERLTGEPYETHVQHSVCAPSGISEMRIAGTRLEERLAGEARYYDYAGAPMITSVFPSDGSVARPYGWTHLPADDAAGGWVASAVDLTRFMTALDGTRVAPLLSTAMVSELTARPPLPEWSGAPSWYALGMQVQPTPLGEIWHHGGSMPGTSAEMMRAPEGRIVVLLLNGRPADSDVDRFEQDLVDTVAALATRPFTAGSDDLYPLFP
jgi:N-acyl-D-amino-acid deacylase